MPIFANWTNRGAISRRISEIANRVDDLTPLREPVRKILVDGNRERSLSGKDAQGRPFAPLAPSTLRNRTGTGPPLAPHYSNSRVVTGYNVDVRTDRGTLTFAASWPDQPWMEYHHTGTPRMPRRDPYGFREQDIEEVRILLMGHVA